MIKCVSYEVDKYDENGDVKVVTASLASDTKSEVVTMGNIANNVDGLPNGVTLAAFSDCFTAKQELVILNSSGVWE